MLGRFMHRKLYSITNALVKGGCGNWPVQEYWWNLTTMKPLDQEGHLNHESFIFYLSKKALEAYKHGTSAPKGVLKPWDCGSSGPGGVGTLEPLDLKGY